MRQARTANKSKLAASRSFLLTNLQFPLEQLRARLEKTTVLLVHHVDDETIFPRLSNRGKHQRQIDRGARINLRIEQACPPLTNGGAVSVVKYEQRMNAGVFFRPQPPRLD